MSAPLLVGIMGAGRMGQGYDNPGDEQILSLAHAVVAHPKLHLGGFFDCDERRAETAERKWSAPASPRARDVWLDQPWDVVCIATPDDQHAQDLSDVLDRRPRAVLVEKPLATDPDLADSLLIRARELDVPIMVDFPRRFHSGVAEVAAMIGDGRLGQPTAGTFVYSGTPAHSAVHMLDLFHTWWGDGWSVSLAEETDGTALVHLRRDGLSVAISFVTLPSERYYVWEMSIYCERGKVELASSPEILTVELVTKHPLYGDVDVLAADSRFDMEVEPLLVAMTNALVEAADGAPDDQWCIDREIGSQYLSGGVLRLLGSGHGQVDELASRCRA